jgi:methionine sulfoxide reductase catalytic subunit
MLTKKSSDIPSSEITDKKLYLNRRKFMAGAAVTGAAVLVGDKLRGFAAPSSVAAAGTKLDVARKTDFAGGEKPTPFKDITNYNNFYEFGTDKYSPAALAKNLRTRPWTVSVDGLVNKKKTFDIDAILKSHPLEERIYRHRCVEGWSMVMPWLGFSLADFLREVEPTSKAKYVEFTTLYDPGQMPGQS